MASELTFGIHNGNLIHISEAKNGDACNCICPHCKSQLSARQGKVNSWCFAHKNKEECAYGQETALHQFAKEILVKHLKIKVPSPLPKKYKDTYISFDKVELEKRLGDIIPDVLLYKGQPPNEKLLLVEIKVTHAVDDIKLKKLKDTGLSAIEIDLSDFDFENFDRESIEDQIIHSVNKKCWLYNKMIKENESDDNNDDLGDEELLDNEDLDNIEETEDENETSTTTIIRKPAYKKMDTSGLLEKYISIKKGKLNLNKSFYKHNDKNTIICYVGDTSKITPDPSICGSDKCNDCEFFISEFGLYEFLDNTCYAAMKCTNPKMNIDSIIEALQHRLEKEESDKKEIGFITSNTVVWSIDKKYNYEMIKIIYDYIDRSAPPYSNNVLCVKDEHERFEPIPRICSQQRCGKWCKNFLSVNPVIIPYFFHDTYVYVCKCTLENNTKQNRNKYLQDKLKALRYVHYRQKKQRERKELHEQGRQFREYMKNYKDNK
ncbi:competence protein CoiA family protein [Clostridium sp. C8-1-8]|uniref:competence protein CoiA family protein n=1 Tax=Clostridium sp. C8-1-8 TaxID=2698831 RepID=UPI00136DCFDC|nr:competence protein CoiA family protein [Clostridium sp. C8-1-8]